ncbi:[protein-PII] uridylyltransferase [Croceicoccus naphthovorans]|uniref:Bifunctional uridylyltransferase/uridylyl-removing enzyme n=1 Tax=Croceicoccus naphthovorans TaxID=1348774 RepID=A0A0G3XJU7_9SPHN|nr:[protein-PII] uridylyltransferase [Croceicoccus naphthovorans]AKM10869.1 protein-PII uridylyltransferase [Croceicoccus naphthovorans]MBB3989096.1 [protein-PII] uridylyltransferase [Croceicoccus naphthovorans]
MRKVPNQRAVIDRRRLAAKIEKIATAGDKPDRKAIVAELKESLAKGRAEIASRLEAEPSAGHKAANAQAFLIDQLIRVIHDYVIGHVYPLANRSSGERIAILAVGGYGRAEMAPQSDVDIAFITPIRNTAWCEQVIEAMLYLLWDLGLKVGHSSRSLDDMVRMAKQDLTIRTSLLEARYLWGDQDLYDQARDRFWNDVVKGTERQFIAEKLEERDARHKRMGDSRYVVEPNVKEGKGGLRDLQTLYWIGKYIHRVRSGAELVEAGLLTQVEYRSFRRAENFFWAVRCHMHMITGREEDRLTFDLQREVADRMNFVDRPGKSSVERFMRFYFLQAKRVGSLTGVFLAQLDEQFASKSTNLLSRLRGRKRTLKGFEIAAGRINVPDDTFFQKDPVRLVEIFTLANREGLEVHPEAMRKADRDAALIDRSVRNDPRANALFLDLLASHDDPELALRWMNEAGVFGRIMPEFGRVVAQMQFDMYHHYTVDEHTIRAIGKLAKIEAGEVAESHPISTKLIAKLKHRRALYVATLMHDIAKGRGGDHSVLGADLAKRVCPRLGMNEEETELVSWLVRNHLLMSATAFKRDLSDPKTIGDFVEVVQSLERLRQLLVLTVVDIGAVGPGVWNSWKGQLLADLYFASEERIRLGHKGHGRDVRIAAKKDAVIGLMGDEAGLVEDVGQTFHPSYWIAEQEDVIASNLRQLKAKGDAPLSIETQYHEDRGATLVTAIGADHPGLFSRICGAIHLAGANIIDARIHTTRRGIAVDNFLVQDPHGRPFHEDAQLTRLVRGIEEALANKVKLVPQLAARPLTHQRSHAFEVRPRVEFDNGASSKFTVIEVNARDRPALLNRLSRALFEAKTIINSAHITNYGERAADTFYVTDLLGDKIVSESRLKTLEKKLLEAVQATEEAAG